MKWNDYSEIQPTENKEYLVYVRTYDGRKVVELDIFVPTEEEWARWHFAKHNCKTILKWAEIADPEPMTEVEELEETMIRR